MALAAAAVWVLVDEGMEDIDNLIGLPGLFIMILICLLCSSNPGLVRATLDHHRIIKYSQCFRTVNNHRAKWIIEKN